jgi:hypothetical protein
MNSVNLSDIIAVFALLLGAVNFFIFLWDRDPK